MRFKVLWKLGLKVLLTVEEVVDGKKRRIGWRVWGFKWFSRECESLAFEVRQFKGIPE
jgi:hypothetical protein